MRNVKESKDRADAVVVGGGVVGLSIARELGRRGLSVTLVERGRPGMEASYAAGGMLAPQAEADCADEFFRLQSASRDMYPKFADALYEETNYNINLDQTGTLYLAFTEEDEVELEKRYTWQRRAGLEVELLTSDDVRVLEPSVSSHVRMALKFKRDWQVENRLLVDALAASAASYSVRILSGTFGSPIHVDKGERNVIGIETSNGFINTEIVVLAVGAWTSQIKLFSVDERDVRSLLPLEHPKIVPVRGQMLSFEMRRALFSLASHVIYSTRGYIVPRRTGRLLAGSTTEFAGFNSYVTGRGVQTILTHAQEIMPAIGDLPLVDSWAGLRPCAEDEWPVLDMSDEVGGLYYATGHYRNGILLAPITGRLMAEFIINNRKDPLLEAFTLERFQMNVRCAHGHNGE